MTKKQNVAAKRQRSEKPESMPGKRKTKKSQSSNSLWMVLMAVSFSVLVWLKGGDSISSSVEGLTHLHEDMVDFFLKDVEAKRQLRKAKVEVENFYYAPEIDDFSGLRPGASEQDRALDYGVDMDQPGEAARIFQEIDRGSQMASGQLPDEIINQKLLRMQEYEVYQQKMEQAYVEEFKENALKAGYKVEVDKDLQVQRVRKVRVPGSSYED